jgi:hypothetical protein
MDADRHTGAQSIASFCGGAADVVTFCFGLLFYCTYGRYLAEALADTKPRPRPKINVDPPSPRATATGRRTSRASGGPEPEAPDVELGYTYEGPEKGLEPDAAAWTVAEIGKVQAELLDLDDASLRARLRTLRRRYHPDKNPGREFLVTPVFQYVQRWHEDFQD